MVRLQQPSARLEGAMDAGSHEDGQQSGCPYALTSSVVKFSKVARALVLFPMRRREWSEEATFFATRHKYSKVLELILESTRTYLRRSLPKEQVLW
jgi:hypothetical protein